VSARKEVASLAGHAYTVCSVAFSPDGNISFLEVLKSW
jgi:hypothetical protein